MPWSWPWVRPILYHDDKLTLMEVIDQELMIGASSVRYILPDDFHDRALAADSIDPKRIGGTSMP